MKKFVIEKCMNYIKKHKNYSNTKLKEIEYGLTSIFLSVYKMIIIFSLSIYLNLFKEVIIYLILFNILRSTACGLHAKNSFICLISSILIFIFIPLICIYMKFNIYAKIIIGTIGIILMYKNSPADTYKRPIINKKRRFILKTISTLIVIIYFILSLYISDNFITNSLLLSIILENFLISKHVYKLFKLPYNNYISYLKKHPNLNNV